MKAQNANKNYIAIGVSVWTTNRTACNSGSVTRQESNPHLATTYILGRWW